MGRASRKIGPKIHEVTNPNRASTAGGRVRQSPTAQQRNEGKNNFVYKNKKKGDTSWSERQAASHGKGPRKIWNHNQTATSKKRGTDVIAL